MEEKATLIESLVEKAEVYAKSSVDLFTLKAINKSSNIISSIASTLIISVIVVFITMLVNIGAALWIGELIGSSLCGFFIVAAFYTIIAIVLCAFRNQLLKTPFGNIIINHIRKEKNIL